jgi:hypothetical protein
MALYNYHLPTVTKGGDYGVLQINLPGETAQDIDKGLIAKIKEEICSVMDMPRWRQFRDREWLIGELNAIGNKYEVKDGV